MKAPSDKTISLVLALTFAAVGSLFLLRPDAAVRFMNGLGRGWGFPEAPLTGANFYLGLAAGYMYLVTVLAWMMYRDPAVPLLPLLLAHAKGASSLFSLGLFVFHRSCFIYAANGVVDLTLAVLAAALWAKRKRRAAQSR
jgi:hypothetical protein